MSARLGERPIAVTGASGLLGGELLRQLAQAGTPVTALSRQSRANSTLVRWHQGDLRRFDELLRWLPPDALVIHLGAALTGSPALVSESIVEGTRNLLGAASQRGARLLHVSSLAVIDPLVSHARGTVDEEAPLDPQPAQRGAYSRAKIVAEQLVREYADAGGDTVIIRPGQLVSRRLAAVPASVGILRWNRLLMLGAPHETIPIVHASDAAAGLMIAAEASRGAILHLVDELPVRRDTLLAALMVAEIPGAELPVLDLHRLAALAHLLPGRGRRLVALDTKARYSASRARQLGWNPVALPSWLTTGQDP